MTQKLELTWVDKDKRLKVEPRILIKREDLSYKRTSNNLLEEGIYDNVLIHGDNLLALRALENKYSGKIKCIYIDPPYNTGSAFEHYDDNVEHSTWLSLMRDRLIILRKLLSDDGSIWISIDSDECHYLKVLCDEIFGRQNFIDEIVWQRAYAPINLKKTLSRSHDIILVYAKKFDDKFRFNTLPRSSAALERYKNPDNDPRGLWQSDNLWCGPRVEANVFEIVTPSGRSVYPPDGYSSRLSKERFDEYVKDNRIWFGPNGDNTPRIKRFFSEVKDGVVAMTWWPREEIGDNQEAKREIKSLGLSDKPFDTPKPERLIQRILTIATNEGDLVLDSFLGSGTTAAVAHKMKRRWIGIEMGDTVYTYCKNRLDLIINGVEKGGITKNAKWESGGGYDFYELAPTLIKEDCFGEAIINKEYNSEMLAAAIALHEGFTYSPDSKMFWKQSKSTENSYLFVTTAHLSELLVKEIEKQMLEDEFLLIACKSFDKSAANVSDKIKIKKIPQMLLGKCEFGKDDYSLNIINPPFYEYEEEDCDE